jgi:hypothetical protein
MSQPNHEHRLSILDEIDRARSTRTNSDIEDALHRAVKMSSIAVTLAEKAFADTAESLGGLPKTYFMHDQDVDTLLFSIIEAHAQAREAFDMLVAPDDDAPAKAVAEAADANGRAVQS